MAKTENIYLTPSEVIFIINASLIGIGIMSLPNSVIKVAKQDGWISCLIGSVYPIYMVLIANYLCSKSPKDNVLNLSKKCFGRLIGSVLNFIFLSFFIFIGTVSLSGFSNLIRIYAVPLLKNNQVISSILVVTAYIAYKGAKSLGRLCKTLFYITIPLIIIPIATYKYGMFINLKPIFGSGLKNIIIASKETAFEYTGLEIVFLIYPIFQDRRKLLKSGLVSIAIVVFIYTLFVFNDIYYFGIDIPPKFIWPIVTLADSIKIPVINSFRYIFVSLWALIALKCISTYYFAAAFGLNQVIERVPTEVFVIFLYPIFFFIAMLYGNPTARSNYIGKLTPIYVIYNIIYVSSIAVLIHFKKGDNIEKA